MKKTEYYIGFIFLAIILVLGATMLSSKMLLFRLIMGLFFGYTLTRSYMGFAGSVNRACRAGSTKLMRALMVMFVISAALTAILLSVQSDVKFGLWINPINFGLVIGGILFGIGMSFSMCCASGVLTDIVTGLPRAFVTLVFFGMGVFLGFPLQKTSPLIRKSLVRSSEKVNGVFLPDLFRWDGLNGYLGAVLFTAILAGIVYYLSVFYEKKRKTAGSFVGLPFEEEQTIKYQNEHAPANESMYHKLFVRPWNLMTGVVLLSLGYIVLMAVTKSGWGASTPYGHWFGKALKLFIPVSKIAKFSHVKESVFNIPFFSHPIYVQNIAIVLGTVLALLLAGNFASTFKEGLKMKMSDILWFAAGGFLMGFGTRFSNGCNLGALYTPVANLSLSGWLFLVTLVVGGVIGNRLYKRFG